MRHTLLLVPVCLISAALALPAKTSDAVVDAAETAVALGNPPVAGAATSAAAAAHLSTRADADDLAAFNAAALNPRADQEHKDHYRWRGPGGENCHAICMEGTTNPCRIKGGNDCWTDWCVTKGHRKQGDWAAGADVGGAEDAGSHVGGGVEGVKEVAALERSASEADEDVAVGVDKGAAMKVKTKFKGPGGEPCMSICYGWGHKPCHIKGGWSCFKAFWGDKGPQREGMKGRLGRSESEEVGDGEVERVVRQAYVRASECDVL